MTEKSKKKKRNKYFVTPKNVYNKQIPFFPFFKMFVFHEYINVNLQLEIDFNNRILSVALDF